MTEIYQSLWPSHANRPGNGCGVGVSRATRDAMLEFVANRHQGVTSELIMSKLRIKRIAHARQEVMWRLRRIKGADGSPRHSYPAIARALGLGDHTTVIHGVRAHERRMAAQ